MSTIPGIIILGVTGSIAMGKSTVTKMFETSGAATTNADQIVHDLYTSDADVIAYIQANWPSAVAEGKVDRKKLGAAVFGDDVAIKKLEHLLHPKVKQTEEDFVLQAREEGKWLAVLDIPLLYETGAEKRCDYVAVASSPYEIQKARALSRPNMTAEKFEQILARQVPDAEKRARADFIVDTGKTLLHSESDVKKIIKTLKGK